MQLKRICCACSTVLTLAEYFYEYAHSEQLDYQGIEEFLKCGMGGHGR
jgi:hypothetical protein